jgi:hypothetical protein
MKLVGSGTCTLMWIEYVTVLVQEADDWSDCGDVMTRGFECALSRRLVGLPACRHQETATQSSLYTSESRTGTKRSARCDSRDTLRLSAPDCLTSAKHNGFFKALLYDRCFWIGSDSGLHHKRIMLITGLQMTASVV